LLGLFEAILAKIASAGWLGYVATAAAATAITGGSIVALSESGVVNVTAGLTQQVQLPFSFKPAALGTLDQVYGSLAAGASIALTGAGIQLPPLQLGQKIAAVSDKIIAEAQADKASLQKLSENVDKLAGFKPSEDSKQITGTTPTPGGSVTVVPSSTPLATNTPAATATQTRTSTPTQTPTITVTPTITDTPTATVTPTATATPCPATFCTVTPTPTDTPTPTPTGTPCATNNSFTLPLNYIEADPGGPSGVTASTTISNCGAHPFSWSMTTILNSGSNALWTDTTNGLQMAVDEGVARDPNSPTVKPGGNTNLYTGSIQVTNKLLLGFVCPNQSHNLSVTVWLPKGPTAPGPNALTPNPGNQLQGLSVTVNFRLIANELVASHC
jgi:hypothetical protein